MLAHRESRYEVWRQPARSYTAWPLLAGGVAVFQRNGTNDFEAVDIDTGAVLWTDTAPPSAGFYRGGCIVANRLFLGASNNGSGSGSLRSVVECLDLSTGASLWTFDTGTVGAISSLQAVTAAGGLERVVFTVGERGTYSGTYPWNNHRVYVLDANAAAAGSALVAVSAPNTGSRLAYHTVAASRNAVNGTDLFVHEYSRSGVVWPSQRVRSLALSGLAEPNPANLSLSGASLSNLNTIGFSPPVVDQGAREGFLYDTNGSVVAIDLDTMTVTWTAAGIGTVDSLAPYVLSTAVVLPDPVAGTLTGLSRASGAVLWTLSTTANTLPAAPLSRSGVVLASDRVLLVFANGDIREVDAAGNLGAARATVPNAVAVRVHGEHYLVVTNSELVAFRNGFEQVLAGCGQGRLEPSGSPTLGGIAVFTAVAAGPTMMLAGLGLQPFAFCAACTSGVGQAPAVALFGSQLSIAIPNDASFLGLEITAQAAALAPGGCTQPVLFTLTNAIRMTVL